MLKRVLFLAGIYTIVSCGSSVKNNRRFTGNSGNVANNAKFGEPKQSELNKAFDLAKVEPLAEKNVFSRLTKKEYRFVVADLLSGLEPTQYQDLTKIINSFSDSPYQGAYNNLSTFSVFNNIEKQHLEMAKSLAGHFQKSAYFKKYCSTSGNCLNQLVDQLLPRIWRKSVSADEKSEMSQLYSTAKDGKKEYFFLLRAFMSAYFHNKIVGKDFSHVSKAYQLGSVISFSMTGSLPDDELFEDMKSGAVEHPNVGRKHIARLLQKNPERFAHLFASQWLSYSTLAETAADTKFHEVLVRDIMKEIDKIFEQIIRENDKIESMFDIKHNIVNSSLAKLYGENVSGSEWEKITVKDSNLFSTAFMSYRFVSPMSDVPNPITRGLFVVQNLLCEEVAAPTADEIAAAQKVVENADAELKKMGKANPSPAEKMEYYRTMSACKSCHLQFDFHGLAMENIGLFGKFRDKYYTGGAINIGNKVGDIEYSSSNEYVHKLGKMRDVNLCFMGHVYQYFSTQRYLLVGRELLKRKQDFGFADQISVSKTVEDLAVQSLYGK